MKRDFEANPYTPHEQRVADYLMILTRIGGGDDPIEYLIASHQSLLNQIKALQDYINDIDRAGR